MDIIDHFPTITLIPRIKNLNTVNDTFKCINYKLQNNEIKYKKWENVFNGNNINEKLLYIVNVCTIDKKIVSKYKRNNEWMTASLLCSTGSKNELFLKVKKYPLNKNLLSYYKKYRNKYNSIVKLAKNNCYKNKFSSYSNNSKFTWK